MMFGEIKRTTIAAAILGAFGVGNANAIGFTAGDWTMDISGSVNAFYTQLNCDRADTITGGLPVCGLDNQGNPQDSAAVQNGLLPGYIKFTGSTKYQGLDVKGVVGMWPGTSNAQPAQTVGDVRTVFIEFGAPSWGSLKLGRDIGLFQQKAILNDMTLLGVGTGANFQGAINTTLGMIGTGYIYTEFQPQITYSTPDFGGLQASFGIFQPRNSAGVGGFSGSGVTTKTPGVQALVSYGWKGDFAGEVWGSYAQQEIKTATATIDKVKGHGFELGGKVGFGGLEAMLVGFTGEGLGSAIQFTDGHGADGEKRDSDGFLAQLTYKLGSTKLGLSYGENKLDFANAADQTANANLLDKSRAYVVGVYHALTPNLTLVGEFIDQERTAHNGNINEGNTIALGAILFF